MLGQRQSSSLGLRSLTTQSTCPTGPHPIPASLPPSGCHPTVTTGHPEPSPHSVAPGRCHCVLVVNPRARQADSDCRPRAPPTLHCPPHPAASPADSTSRWRMNWPTSLHIQSHHAGHPCLPGPVQLLPLRLPTLTPRVTAGHLWMPRQSMSPLCSEASQGSHLPWGKTPSPLKALHNLPSHLLALPLTGLAPAILFSAMFPQNKNGPASGPLHWLLCQPKTLSLQHPQGQLATPSQTTSSVPLLSTSQI